MSDKVELKTFPADKYDALALVYLQTQDLSEKTPEEVIDLFNDALKRMRKKELAKQQASY